MAINDDELPRPKGVPGLPRPLDPLGLDELREYRALLEEEVRRVDAEIARKQSIRGSAASLFKS